MIKNLILTCSLLIPVLLAVGCSRQPTVPEAEFGDTVRNVMDSQIHDYEAALHPPPEAVEGSDPDRLNNAVGAYRNAITEPQQVQRPINISVGTQ